MSFVSNMKANGKGGKGQTKGKGKGKSNRRDMQCWHCGKYGHLAGECWQKDAEMEAHRAAKESPRGVVLEERLSAKMATRRARARKASIGSTSLQRTAMLWARLGRSALWRKRL